MTGYRHSVFVPNYSVCSVTALPVVQCSCMHLLNKSDNAHGHVFHVDVSLALMVTHHSVVTQSPDPVKTCWDQVRTSSQAAGSQSTVIGLTNRSAFHVVIPSVLPTSFAEPRWAQPVAPHRISRFILGWPIGFCRIESWLY